MQDALMQAVLENVRAHMTERLGAIRDPDTGEFPIVVVRGDSIDQLSVHVEGSPKLVALVKERLGMDMEGAGEAPVARGDTPRVFLSYTADNLALAQKLAEALQAAGIDTWWDRWCIYPGDSLRQKIDEGLTGCTHFLVLLTPQSINKPWVNQEMDAGLVRKLNDQCRFLPLRYDLPASALPPLLAGMHSPAIMTDADIAQLIHDIYGVSRKPPLGAPPAIVSHSTAAQTGYSPAATAIARLFVERSQHGTFADPQLDVDELAQATGLSVQDTRDALYELSSFVKVSLAHVLVQGTLFAEFDRYWKPWNPAEDALQLAADMVHDPQFPDDPPQIAARYGWEPRRLNPVVSYLLERQLIVDSRALGTLPFASTRIVGNDRLRRFVKSRS